jgi:proline iminopeptidase
LAVSSLPAVPAAEAAPRRWRLPASNAHVLQVHQWGPPEGVPALLLHGGPGSGCSPTLAAFFDPRRYRVIGVDQRGAGGSTPAGGVEHNTTALLLADLRLLRRACGVGRWLVVGGSWGATLAVLHALDEPDAIAGLLLRGLFLARRDDVERFFDGAVREGPPAWRAWAADARSRGVPLVAHLSDLLAQADTTVQLDVARHWWAWEQSLQGAAATTDAPPLHSLLGRYRIQAHYLRHGCWLADTPLLERLHALPAVPTLLLHGGRDRMCPPEGARLARDRMPHARLRIVADAGHAPTHPAMAAAMRAALDRFAASGDFDDPSAR